MEEVIRWGSILWLFAMLVVVTAQAQLSTDFYKKSCPDLENIVKETMAVKFKQTPVVAAGTLRLFFHDCMVEGCDASVIIGSTPNNKAEKDAEQNLSLPGDAFDAVMKAKAAVEKECKGTVSCADLLALATRDLLVLIGGPSWTVKLGRRDGRNSKASNVPGNLPTVNMTVGQLSKLFNRKRLSRKDMVTLSGGHSAGFSHCDQFMDRLYNWKNTGRIDPTMNPNYAANLRATCPQVGLDPTIVANLDTTTPTTFDNVFYKNAQNGLALLRSDQILFNDDRTKAIVNDYAASQSHFFAEFAAAMEKLSNVGVKTGSQGEIRNDCGAFN